MLLAIVAFIWGNSLLPAELSQKLSDWVKLVLLGPSGDGASLLGGSGLLRKIAHFTEFFALGICLCWLFAMLGKNPIWPLLCGLAVACVDETIQYCVPDRGPGLLDVGLDTAGVAVGIGFLLLAHNLFTKRK